MSKKRKRHEAPPGPLDHDTRRTLQQMVGYMGERHDRKIARYLRVGIEFVQWARRVSVRERDPLGLERKPVPSERGEDLDVRRDPWIIDARRGTKALAHAIEHQTKTAGNRNSPPCSFPTKGRISPGGPLSEPDIALPDRSGKHG